MATRRLLASLALTASLLACSKSEGPKHDGAPHAEERDPTAIAAPFPVCAPGVEPLPSHIERGICLAHNYQRAGSRGYGSDTSRATLEELVQLGVRWVSITPFGFMQRLDEPTVHPIGNYRAGETDDRVIREIEAAKSLGLRVMLKPHIWIVDGKWRGKIAFDDDASWRAWFDAYDRWMLHYADLSAEHGVEVLVVGVELRSTERKLERRWRKLVREVRRRFKGKLTYSANWDDAAALTWWDALDYVGVQFYPPLAERPRPTRLAVDRVLDQRLDELEELSKRVDRPVIFTEVGFRAADDALIHPHAWPERAGSVELDPRTQALGYECVVDAIRKRDWIAGIYWWKWFTDPNTTEEGPAGFSPRDKLAESVLRAAYAGNCDARSTAP